MPESKKTSTLIPPHGGYRDLQSYQMAEIVYDATVSFSTNNRLSSLERVKTMRVMWVEKKQEKFNGNAFGGFSRKENQEDNS